MPYLSSFFFPGQTIDDDPATIELQPFSIRWAFFFLSFSGYTLVPPLPDSLMGLVGQGRRRKIKLTSVTEGDWHLRALVIQ